MIYLCALASNYGALLLSLSLRYKGKLFIFLAVISLGFIAVFRGMVGTDTVSYEAISSAYRQGENISGWEPGFVFLINFLQIFISDDRIIVRTISAVFVALTLIYITFSNKNELFYFTTLYIPAYFFSHSMNVLRLGLASILVLLALQLYRRSLLGTSGSIAILSIFFHYSAAIPIIFIAITSKRLDSNKIWSLGLFFIILILTATFLNSEYIISKFELYEFSNAPSPMSGLSIVAQAVSLSAGVLLCKLRARSRHVIFFSMLIFISIFYILTLYSYAGLRLLSLSLFAASLSILNAHNEENFSFNRELKMALLTTGFFAMIAGYLGWLREFGVGDSPFLPYELIWS